MRRDRFQPTAVILNIGATHSFDETSAPFLVLVPGSEANTTTAMADRRLIAWLKKAHETSTWTTSVCSGALILAAAGLLEGEQATTHWWAQSSLKRFGAIAMPNDRVVRSGKIWTAAESRLASIWLSRFSARSRVRKKQRSLN